MDQSCELPADVPDDAMEAETKADNKEEGMVSGGPDIGCLASVLVVCKHFLDTVHYTLHVSFLYRKMMTTNCEVAYVVPSTCNKRHCDTNTASLPLLYLTGYLKHVYNALAS